ncbi:MAG: hypothetical protein J5802_02505 [Butyrivibrio sp.]|nr:hypothetical protein [Butyrivibrio sp.]
MKKKIATYLMIVSMIATTCACSNSNTQTSTENNKETSTEASTENASAYVSMPDDIQTSPQINNKPEINDDLLGAIEQLAISYKEFDSERETKDSNWQQTFIDHFIRGNWDGYSYKKQLENDNDCIATKEDVEYIQRSLTGIDISFDSIKDGETIDMKNSVNATNNQYGKITNYETKKDKTFGENTTYMNAEFETGFANSDEVYTYNLIVYLKENPESCFGGYNIISLNATDTTVYAEPGSEHSIYGWYSDEYFLKSEYSLTIWLDIDRSADNLEYSYDLTVEITEKQRQYIIDHFYDEFKITYTFEKDMKPPINRVKATKIEVVSDKEAAGDLSDADSDPLKDLVADDILEKFRASRPVRNESSVYEESYILGKWVMKTIGKDNMPESLKEKAQHIGAGNEFWFGTDVSNNFSNDFATMYETYYMLKDYYNSNGKNNANFYENIIHSCWEENSSENPAIIKSMYDDLQEFVSECNNLIRDLPVS